MVDKQIKDFSIERIRGQFPIFKEKVCGQPLAYLDSGATSQKPKTVTQRISNYYGFENANVHRGAYYLSEVATKNYEDVRNKVSKFINAPGADQVIFTKGTTDSINIVAHAWAESQLKNGDTVAVSRVEHHSNFVPWQSLAKKNGWNFKIIEVDTNGRLDLSTLEKELEGVSLFAMTQMSNALGTIYPIQEIVDICSRNRIVSVIDCAQSVPHFELNLEDISGVDFISFSAHKVCGPTGVGVLWGKRDRLEEMQPFIFGGDMISDVGDIDTTWNQLPWRFEAGTPNIAGVIGFGAALDFLESFDRMQAKAHERNLGLKALDSLLGVEGLKLVGPTDYVDRGPVFSFILKGVHSFDLATFLDRSGICVRAGHHCAQPLLKKLDLDSTCRASFAFYNNAEDLDRLVSGLNEARRYFLK